MQNRNNNLKRNARNEKLNEIFMVQYYFKKKASTAKRTV